MKKYNFDECVNRRGTRSVKWDSPYPTSAASVYPLWVADMDFVCSDAIVKALHACADEQVYGYSIGLDQAYKRVVMDWFARRFDWHVKADSIFYAGGVVPAIAYLLAMLSEEGDGVIIQTPVYHPFRKKIEATKRVVVENPLCNHNGYYTMNFEELDAQMQRREVKGMILCSPHNPVGRVWSKEELLHVHAIAQKHHKWIISDEIHGDIIRASCTHHPLAKLVEDTSSIITCTAPSKTFNLAGLQNSHIIIDNPEYQKRWMQFVWDRLSIVSPNTFAIHATMAAYSASDDWLAQVNAYIDENIAQATAFIQQQLPKAVVSPAQGTYLLWVDVRGYCHDEKVLEKCMRAYGLRFNEGYIFGDEGKCFERINVACPRSFLCESLARFCEAIQSL